MTEISDRTLGGSTHARGGVKAFDDADALDRAMIAFWHGGYAATGLGEIERVTGLNRSSLYNAFGSKDALFRATLDRYAETVAVPGLVPLDMPDAREGIVEMLRRRAVRMTDGALPPGCLFSRTTLERGHEDGDTGEVTRARQTWFLRRVEAAVVRGQNEGTVRGDADPTVLAASIVALSHGMAVMSRARAPAEAIAALVDAADDLLQPR